MSGNPFAELSAVIPAGYIQMFVGLMVVLVVAGTLFDVWHKRSAQYFFENWRKSKSRGAQVGGVEVAVLAGQTLASEVLTSSEFCNARRRIAHLLTMYGFVAYCVATAVMVFGYLDPAASTPGIWSFLWYLGALSVCVGGYWFWFYIRVDVAAEGNSPLRVVRADLFVLSLLAGCTFGLLWALFQGSAFGWVCFIAYVIATAVLFGGVPWSKFAHMFFKPAAALQKRVAVADGSMDNLPAPAEQPERFGPGIKRELPRHY